MEKLIFRGCYIAYSVMLMPIDGITYLVGVGPSTLFCKKLSYRDEFLYRSVKHTESSYGNCLTAIDKTIYSCNSNEVRTWMLTNTNLVRDRTYETKSAFDELKCVSSCPERALFAAGSFYGTVDVFDSRSSNKPIYQYRPHTEYVTQLAMNTEYILSASEDKTVSVWDQRAGRTMKSIPIPGHYAVPTCMSMRRDNWVCVGDSDAKLHMLDPKNDFELVKSYSTEHTDVIARVRLTHGCLITFSRDDTVRISFPTDPPKLITTLKSGRFYSMDYLNGTLVTSGVNIDVWGPRNRRV